MNKASTILSLSTLVIALNCNDVTLAATIVDIDGTSYKVFTVEGKFEDLEDMLRMQPWWGDQGTATTVAIEVGDSLGLPNSDSRDFDYGPLFAFGTGGTSGDRTTEAVALAPEFPNRDPETNIQRFGLSPSRHNGTWAKAEPIPEPLTILGVATAIAFGTSFKRQINKK